MGPDGAPKSVALATAAKPANKIVNASVFFIAVLLCYFALRILAECTGNASSARSWSARTLATHLREHARPIKAAQSRVIFSRVGIFSCCVCQGLQLSKSPPPILVGGH